MNAVVRRESPKDAARRLAAGAIRDGYKPAALHEYQDADGNPAYWRIRAVFEPITDDEERRKWIRPMYWDGNRFVIGEPPAPAEGKLLYRLPELLADPAALVWIVEGESCADALAHLGLTVTTSGGADSANAADWHPLAGRRCLIWPDHDEPGAKYADAVAAKLEALGATVERIDTAALGLAAKDDCVDWLARHPDATAEDLEALPRLAEASGGEAWPEPQPLTARVEPEPYPIDALPSKVRAAVEEVAGFVKAPIPLVASSAIAALSLAIQAYADVKRAESLAGPTALFLLTIADSGERKSTCDGIFTRAIRDYEQAQREAGKPLLKDHAARLEAWEAKRGGIKEAIRQLAKANKPTTSMEAAMRELEHNRPEPPRIPRLLYADATPEALAYGLAKQWPAAGVVSAEAGIVFGSHGMGKDSVMRNLATLNQLWDGNALHIDRRASESFTVTGARLTMALQVQEATLRDFFSRSGALARGSGFLARFLVACPQSTQGSRPFTEAPESWPHLAAFNRRLSAILGEPAPVDENGALSPPLLPLAPEAKAAWVAYHDALERELRSGGELHSVRDVASKSADNAARLAALFHVFGGGTGAIGLEALNSACRIAAWHLNEARRFFGELALPPELADAVRLDSFLIDYCRQGQVDHVPTREAQRLGPVRDKERLTRALAELEELGRVKVIQAGKRRTVTLNPALLGFATATPATPATHPAAEGRTVATVATVAVADTTGGGQ